MPQITFTVASVTGSGGSKTQDETGFVNLAFITRINVVPSAAGGTYQVQLFQKDGFAIADLAYNTGAVTGTFDDPYENDDGTTTPRAEDNLIVAVYEDEDSSTELHVKVINNDASTRSFDFTVDYLQPVINGRSDNVGIGTTSPLSTLHVGPGADNSIQTRQLEVNNTGTAGQVWRDSTNDLEVFLNAHGTFGYGIFGMTSNHAIRVRTNNADRMTVDANGHVGINTTATPSGGGVSLALGQASGDPTGIGSNTAGLVAKDSGGTAELYAWDEAGNVTQLTPHDPETGEWYLRSANIYTGEVRTFRLEKALKALAALAGEEFIELGALGEDDIQDWDENQERLEREADEAIAAWEKGDPDQRGEKPQKYRIKPDPFKKRKKKA